MEEYDCYLGAAAQLLMLRGQMQEASILAQSKVVEAVVKHVCFHPGCYEDSEAWAEAWSVKIEVAPVAYLGLTEDSEAVLHNALNEVLRRTEYVLGETKFSPALPDGDWRSGVYAGELPAPVNPREERLIDGFFPVLSNGEEVVYHVLKQAQEKRPQERTFTIVPNAYVRVRGQTFRPDFLMIQGKRAAVIEIDGGHQGKREQDASRDHLLLDAGIGFVYRMSEEDALDRDRRTAHLKRFFHRLENL